MVSSDIIDFYGSLLPFPSALGRTVCVRPGQCVSGWHHWFVKHAVYPPYSFNLLHAVFLRHSYFQMLPVWGGERFSMWLLNEPRVWKGSFSAGYFLGRLLIATEDVNACQRVWGILSSVLTLSFEAELFRTEQILSRPMNSSVPESLPAAAKFKECFTQALTERRWLRPWSLLPVLFRDCSTAVCPAGWIVHLEGSTRVTSLRENEPLTLITAITKARLWWVPHQSW